MSINIQCTVCTCGYILCAVHVVIGIGILCTVHVVVDVLCSVSTPQPFIIFQLYLIYNYYKDRKEKKMYCVLYMWL